MPKSMQTLKNGVKRSEVETIILLAIGAAAPNPVMVKHFVMLGAFMGSAATEKQFSYIAQRMAETGEIVQTTIAGNYAYRHWADVAAS